MLSRNKMGELRFSCLRIAVLVEVTLLICCYLYSPAEQYRIEYVKKEHGLYVKRKELLGRSVDSLQQEIDLWEVTPLQKETFAREQLNMARPDEIVYYCSQRDNHDR